MTAVAGSGIKIMSDSLIPFQPAIDEPSNILPSVKNPTSTRRVGMVTCCSLPSVSVKRRSANLASFSLISLITSAGVIGILAKVFDQGPDQHRVLRHCSLCASGRHIRIKNLRRHTQPSAPYQSTKTCYMHYFGAL